MKPALRILITALGLLFLGAGTGWAQAEQAARPMLLETAASERLLEEGRRQLFAFRMPAAERTFEQLAARPDGALAGQHHLAMAALFKALASDDEAHFEAFYARSDAVEELLEEVPGGPWVRQLAAENDFLRTAAYGKQDRRWKAAWAARAAFGGFEGLVREHPDFDEAYLGLGLLHFAVASLPGTYRRVLGWLGFSGTAEQGLREMRRAAEQSRFNAVPARLTLGLMDLVFYQEPERGAAALARVYEQNPESVLYQLLYGMALLGTRQAAAAEDVLRRAMAALDDPQYFFIDYAEFHLADALFRQGDYEGAETHFRRYIGRHRGPALRVTAFWYLGLAVEMQGRRGEAVRYYEQARAGRDLPSDAAARRRAGERLKAPLTPRERQLLRARGAYDAGEYAAADALLQQVLQDPEITAAERGEAVYRRGRVLEAQERFAEALAAYQQAAAHPGDPHAKWGPWSLFHMGEVHEAQGRAAQAAVAYERVLAYDAPFDYDEALKQVAKAALERVQTGGAASSR